MSIRQLQAYTVKDLAQAFNISRSQVYKLARTGELRTFAIGKRGLRISAEEVEKWQSGKAGPTRMVASGSEDEKTGKPLPTTAIKMLAANAVE